MRTVGFCVATALFACQGPNGPVGPSGGKGDPGEAGPQGTPGIFTGKIGGTVRDVANLPVEGAQVTTDPASAAATTGADGAYLLSAVSIGIYTVRVVKEGWTGASKSGVSVVANGLVTADFAISNPGAPGVISGKVKDVAIPPNDVPVTGAKVELLETELFATAAADGTYRVENVPPGRYRLRVTPAATDVVHLAGEPRRSVVVGAGTTVSLDITLSQRPSDAAHYVGPSICFGCHSDHAGWKQSLHALGFKVPEKDAAVTQTLADVYGVAADVVADGDGNGQNDFKEGLTLNVAATAAGTKFPVQLSYAAGSKKYFAAMNGKTYEVFFTYGGHGYWKQRFVTRIDKDGSPAPAAGAASYYTLPIQYNEKGPAGSRWVNYNGSHWADTVDGAVVYKSRPGFDKSFDNTCAGCHFTGTTVTRDSDGQFLAHAVNDALGPFDYDGNGQKDMMNVSCESCHGPGSEHVSVAGKSAKIVVPRLLTSRAANETCGQCHFRGISADPVGVYEFPWNDAKGGAFRPGVSSLDDFFEDEGGYWGDEVGHSRKHHQQWADFQKSSHWNNPLQTVACYDCHDPHKVDNTHQIVTQRVEGTETIKTAYEDNSLCLSCHAGYGPFASLTKLDAQSIGDDASGKGDAAVRSAVAAHMRTKVPGMGGEAFYDPKTTAFGRCVTCHMAYTASSAIWYSTPTGELLRGDIRSHVFDPILPQASHALATAVTNNADVMPNACAECHTRYAYPAGAGGGGG